MSDERPREIHLLFLDPRVPVDRIEGSVRKAWQDICDLEFDTSFGRFRGVHLDEDNESIHVTWENAYGVTFVSSILPGRDHTRIDHCPQDLYERENPAATGKGG